MSTLVNWPTTSNQLHRLLLSPFSQPNFPRSSWANPTVETYEDTAFFLEADGFDPCGGHATPTGSYHYHGTAGCLQEQAGAVAGEHSPLLGWAYVRKLLLANFLWFGGPSWYDGCCWAVCMGCAILSSLCGVSRTRGFVTLSQSYCARPRSTPHAESIVDVRCMYAISYVRI